MKRFVALSLIMGLMIGATAMVGTAQAAKVIKIAGMKAEGEPETIGMHKFGEYLEKLSNGKYKVRCTPTALSERKTSISPIPVAAPLKCALPVPRLPRSIPPWP